MAAVHFPPGDDSKTGRKGVVQAVLVLSLIHIYHVFIGSDVAELQIETGELGGMLVGVALLGAEHRACLLYTSNALFVRCGQNFSFHFHTDHRSFYL